jgi:phosphoserine phosphatase RsbU/P
MKTVADLTILFVDDEPDIIRSLRRFLRKEPYGIVFAEGGHEALDILQSQEIQIIVTDLRMPEMDGLELIQQVKKRFPESVRVVLSASQDITQTIESINSGEVYRFIPKPLEPESFKQIMLDAAGFYLMKTGREELIRELSASNKSLTTALETVNEVNARKNKLEKNAREVEKKIEQHLLQTEIPGNIEGVGLSAISIPSGHLDGDFFDFIPLGRGVFDLVIADVMGKGLQSALVGAGIKSMILKVLSQQNYGCSPQVDHPEKKLEQLLSKVHNISIKKLIDLEIFVTLCYARFDLVHKKMAFVDCGHTKTIHYQAAINECVLLEGENLPLGMVSQANYQEQHVSLQQDDLLLFYSDGISEAENSKGDLFGTERLIEILKKQHHLSPDSLTQYIIDTVKDYTDQQIFSDDFSCIVVRILPRTDKMIAEAENTNKNRIFY